MSIANSGFYNQAGLLMLHASYGFHCRFKRDAILPIYKGSTFRGVFGHALKYIACGLNGQECKTCLLRSQCIYCHVFETRLAVPVPAGVRLSSPPHPFVIQPPDTVQTRFALNDRFDFFLLLFGEVNYHLPHFISAFARMGKYGVGKKINGQRGSFVLERVTADGRTIYPADNQLIHGESDIAQLSLNPSSTNDDNISCIEISLETPLRLKFANSLVADLPFHILVRAMLRRISALMIFYNGGEPPLDYRGLTRRAEEKVSIVDSDLHWYKWERYSNRQKQKMPMGGMIGSVVYKGPMGDFIPLIRFCEKTHVGKQTAFGLGKISLAKAD